MISPPKLGTAKGSLVDLAEPEPGKEEKVPRAVLKARLQKAQTELHDSVRKERAALKARLQAQTKLPDPVREPRANLKQAIQAARGGARRPPPSEAESTILALAGGNPDVPLSLMLRYRGVYETLLQERELAAKRAPVPEEPYAEEEPYEPSQPTEEDKELRAVVLEVFNKAKKVTEDNDQDAIEKLLNSASLTTSDLLTPQLPRDSEALRYAIAIAIIKRRTDTRVAKCIEPLDDLKGRVESLDAVKKIVGDLLSEPSPGAATGSYVIADAMSDDRLQRLHERARDRVSQDRKAFDEEITTAVAALHDANSTVQQRIDSVESLITADMADAIIAKQTERRMVINIEDVGVSAPYCGPDAKHSLAAFLEKHLKDVTVTPLRDNIDIRDLDASVKTISAALDTTLLDELNKFVDQTGTLEAATKAGDVPQTHNFLRSAAALAKQAMQTRTKSSVAASLRQDIRRCFGGSIVEQIVGKLMKVIYGKDSVPRIDADPGSWALPTGWDISETKKWATERVAAAPSALVTGKQPGTLDDWVSLAVTVLQQQTPNVRDRWDGIPKLPEAMDRWFSPSEFAIYAGQIAIIHGLSPAVFTPILDSTDVSVGNTRKSEFTPSAADYTVVQVAPQKGQGVDSFLTALAREPSDLVELANDTVQIGTSVRLVATLNRFLQLRKDPPRLSRPMEYLWLIGQLALVGVDRRTAEEMARWLHVNITRKREGRPISSASTVPLEVLQIRYRSFKRGELALTKFTEQAIKQAIRADKAWEPIWWWYTNDVGVAVKPVQYSDMPTFHDWLVGALWVVFSPDSQDESKAWPFRPTIGKYVEPWYACSRAAWVAAESWSSWGKTNTVRFSAFCKALLHWTSTPPVTFSDDNDFFEVYGGRPDIRNRDEIERVRKLITTKHVDREQEYGPAHVLNVMWGSDIPESTRYVDGKLAWLFGQLQLLFLPIDSILVILRAVVGAMTPRDDGTKVWFGDFTPNLESHWRKASLRYAFTKNRSALKTTGNAADDMSTHSTYDDWLQAVINTAEGTAHGTVVNDTLQVWLSEKFRKVATVRCAAVMTEKVMQLVWKSVQERAAT